MNCSSGPRGGRRDDTDADACTHTYTATLTLMMHQRLNSNMLHLTTSLHNHLSGSELPASKTWQAGDYTVHKRKRKWQNILLSDDLECRLRKLTPTCITQLNFRASVSNFHTTRFQTWRPHIRLSEFDPFTILSHSNLYSIYIYIVKKNEIGALVFQSTRKQNFIFRSYFYRRSGHVLHGWR